MLSERVLNRTPKFDIQAIKERLTCGDILARHGLQWTGGNLSCPFHEDKNPSFSIFDKGRAFKCHSCGIKGDVIELETEFCKGDKKLAMETLADITGTARKLPDQPRAPKPTVKRKVVARYTYTDHDGNELYFVERFSPKGFLPGHTDHTGKEVHHLKGVKRVLYNLPAVAAATEVDITEGEKDADALNNLGRTATTTGSATTWKDAYSDAFNDKTVNIFPDNDKEGAKYASNVALSLFGKAKSIKIVQFPDIPDHGDVSDWLDKGHTVAELRQLIDTTAPLERESLLADNVHTPKRDTAGRPKMPYADCADAFAETIRDPATKLYTMRHWRRQWYVYDDTTGWFPISDSEIQALVVTFLRHHPSFREFCSSTFLASVLANLASFDLCGVREKINMPIWLADGTAATNWMRFGNNRVINVESTAKLQMGQEIAEDLTEIESSPNFFSRDCVNYEYSEFDIPDQFHQYLDRVLPNSDSQDLLRQATGYFLLDSCRYETFFYLYGPSGRNGKTVYLNILSALIGTHNISHVPLEGLAPNASFATWPLAESKVNICGDMPTNVRDMGQLEGRFKDLVSGAHFEYERKNKDKFSVPCRARFIFAGNNLPKFVDRSDALWERMRIIHFPNQIPRSERDPHLADRIIATELPGILNWALDGLTEIIKFNAIPDNPESSEIKEKLRKATDHLSEFLSLKFIPGDNQHRIQASVLREEYNEWAAENGYKDNYSTSGFRAAMERSAPYAIYTHALRLSTGTVTCGFTHIQRRLSEGEIL